MVTWFPVPDDLLNGILQSYRVLYRKASDESSPPVEIVVGNASLYVVISSLMKYTVYSVWVKAVTFAEGPNSAVVNVYTHEAGTPYLLAFIVNYSTICDPYS